MNIINVATNEGTKNLAVVGMLPGYNNIIDTDNKDLEKDLLHNISFIDLYLASYNTGGDVGQDFFTFIKKMLQNLTSNNNFYQYKLLDDNTKMKEAFNKLVKKYLGDNINKIDGMRIIASSDSMATETISNNFGDSVLYQMTSQSKIIKEIQKYTQYANIIKELSYTQAWDMFNSYNTDVNIVKNILAGSALGIKIALPKFFESSSYTHNLSVFFKLTSPAGCKTAVQELIFNPLKLIMIFASPNSFNGLTYAFPFLYRVVAHGNSYLSIGFISDITISRGSMETIYSDDFYPLSIDVRLNIRTISENFANIINGDISSDFNNLGMTSPALSSGIDIQVNSGSTPPEIITVKL